jgi:NADP-dependent 3-hydroxy acid dehydrogenase YdfG
MTEWQGKKYWLIGASDGLGAALAHVMSRAGAHVIVSARSEDKLAALVDALAGKASYQTVDVADAKSVAAAAAAVGPVDGVVYLAGVYWPFAAQEWDAEKATAMADINFTGLMRVMGEVVPQMGQLDWLHRFQGCDDVFGGMYVWRFAQDRCENSSGQPRLYQNPFD